MAGFDKYSNYNENTSHSGIIFGSERPLLEVELNELQQIFNAKLTRIMKGFRSGIIPLSTDSFSFNTSNLTLTLKNCILLEKSLGLTAYISSVSVVMSASNKTAYLEVQEIDADSNTDLKAYGNTAGNSIVNTMIDGRYNAETTRRKVVIYTLKAGYNIPADTDTVKNVLVGTYNYSPVLFTPVKWGLDNPEFQGSISLGRKAGTTVGENSVALGSDNEASGYHSFAHGSNCVSSGNSAFTSGNNCKATGSGSIAFGSGCESSATGSFSIGSYCKAKGEQSFACGYNCETQGESSQAYGVNVIALNNQFVCGHHNDTSLAPKNSTSGTAVNNVVGTALVVGNGTSSTKSNAFRVQSDGATYAKGAYNSTGADYAEYAEWADGNPNNEDRRGYFVTFDEEKPNMIRIAKASDVDILGVVSGNPCIIGNSDECWVGKNLFDEFNSPIYEEVEDVIQVADEETQEIIEKTIMVMQHKVSPDFDPEKEYVHRRDRKEWCAVGWIGVLPVREDGTCEVGGYCTWGDNGLATKAEPSRFNYRVLERVTDNIVKVAIK